MNRDIFKGHWDEIKGSLKQQWGKLTDDDITEMEGNYDKLRGKLEKAYGYQKDEAEREIDSFMTSHRWTEKT